MPNPDDLDIPYQGRKLAVRYASKTSGRMPARDFLEGLPKAARAKFYALITTLADEGEIVNDERFNGVGSGIWELKVGSPGLRLLCFPHRGDWVLTHGCPKLKKKEFQAEVAKAVGIREEHLGQNR